MLARLFEARAFFLVLLTRPILFFSGLAPHAEQFVFETALVITCGFLHLPIYSRVFDLKLPITRVCGTCSRHFQINGQDDSSDDDSSDEDE